MAHMLRNATREDCRVACVEYPVWYTTHLPGKPMAEAFPDGLVSEDLLTVAFLKIHASSACMYVHHMCVWCPQRPE